VFQLCGECRQRPTPAPPTLRSEAAPRAGLGALARGAARPLSLGLLGLTLLALAPNLADPCAAGVRWLWGDDAVADTRPRDPAIAVGALEAPRLHDLSLSDSGENVRWVHPLAGPVRHMPESATRRFGADRDGERSECGHGHCGVDLAHEQGLVVHASADGFVERIVRAPDQKGGNYVKVRHVHGFCSYYMHLDRIRPGLERGALVQAGDPLGTTGRTGIDHSGPHLHFAVARSGATREEFVDPEPMLREATLLPAPAAWTEAETPEPNDDEEADARRRILRRDGV
jgi:murein DD-endopeptidase MepM/ murein hydrolase activator NlpD